MGIGGKGKGILLVETCYDGHSVYKGYIGVYRLGVRPRH